jgi:mannose-6-phosphate isomerase-like protein (cupin superfamily)
MLKIFKIPLCEFTQKVEPVKNTEVYSIHDFPMEHLTVSMTVLHPHKETRGHSHDGIEEVYIFLKGSGLMQLGEDKFSVADGDLILIPSGYFHKVFNPIEKELEFLCIFEKYERK